MICGCGTEADRAGVQPILEFHFPTTCRLGLLSVNNRREGLIIGTSGNSHIEEKAGDTGSQKKEAAQESRKQKPSDDFSRWGCGTEWALAIGLVSPPKIQYMGTERLWPGMGHVLTSWPKKGCAFLKSHTKMYPRSERRLPTLQTGSSLQIRRDEGEKPKVNK